MLVAAVTTWACVNVRACVLALMRVGQYLLITAIVTAATRVLCPLSRLNHVPGIPSASIRSKLSSERLRILPLSRSWPSIMALRATASNTSTYFEMHGIKILGFVLCTDSMALAHSCSAWMHTGVVTAPRTHDKGTFIAAGINVSNLPLITRWCVSVARFTRAVVACNCFSAS